jgi:hypothetical protein
MIEKESKFPLADRLLKIGNPTLGRALYTVSSKLTTGWRIKKAEDFSNGSGTF